MLMVRSCGQTDVSHMPEERRQELKQMFIRLSVKYGRHFINYIRELFGSERWVDFEMPDETFLSRPSMEEEADRFERMSREKNEFFMAVLYQKVFDDADILLTEQQNIAEEIGTIKDREGYYEWSKYIENRCKSLNKRFPLFFRDRLHEFLMPAHRRLIDENEEKPEPGDPVVEIQKEEPNWDKLISMVEGYKRNHNCGFMYGVLEYWIEAMADHMQRSLHVTVPMFWPENARKKLTLVVKKKPLQVVKSPNDDAKLFVGPQRKKFKESPMTFEPFPNLYNGFTKYVPTEDCQKQLSLALATFTIN